jgi:hypothetical protein
MFPGDLSKVAADFQPPLLVKLLVYDCGKSGFSAKSELLNDCWLETWLWKHVHHFRRCTFMSKFCLNGEQKLLSFGPVFGLKRASLTRSASGSVRTGNNEMD